LHLEDERMHVGPYDDEPSTVSAMHESAASTECVTKTVTEAIDDLDALADPDF